MNNELELCQECESHPLLTEIGAIGKDVQIVNIKHEVSGIREVVLYQCSVCKTVTLI